MSTGAVRGLVLALVAFLVIAGVIVALLLSGAFGGPPGPGPSPTIASPTTTPAPTPSATPTATATPSATPTPGTPRQTTSVVIVFTDVNAAGTALDVDGFAEDVLEDGGTCTARLTGSGGSASASGSARAGSTTTTCRTLHIPLDGLPPGAYRVVLTYLSGTASGESSAVDVEIP